MNIAVGSVGVWTISWIQAPSLTSDQINIAKFIAIFLMVLNHVSLLPQVPASAAIVLDYIGRPVFPIFAFIMVYHYVHHTRSKSQYLLRLLTVALIAEGPYRQLRAMSPVPPSWDMLNILFSLGLGLVLLVWVEWLQKFPDVPYFERFKERNLMPLKWFVSTFGFLCIFVASLFVDYLFFGPLMMVAFYFWLTRPCEETMNASIFFTFMLNIVAGILFALTTLAFFIIMGLVSRIDDRSIKKLPKPSKWLFYFFYPVHLAIIVLIGVNI